MTNEQTPKLGKLSLLILENFVKGPLGEGFIKELRSGFDHTAVLREALHATENRFMTEFPDQDLSNAMFIDLSQEDRPSLTEAVSKFYNHPTDPRFQNTLCKILLGEFKSLSSEKVTKAIEYYVATLTEELAMLDADFREKVSFIVNFRQHGQAKSSLPRKTSSKKKRAESIYQIPPLPPQGVIGREEELNQIANMLLLNEPDTSNTPPVALRGMGGIGKTTLAIALAHKPEIRSNFRDGILWTSLGPKPIVRLLLNAWGRVFGIDLLPEGDESACQVRLRQFLYDKKMLVIVDDVWDAIQGDYFQVGGPGCRTVFTTREVPIANHLATRERTIRVEVLKPEAALGLLYKLAPETASVDKSISMKLCERLEFLPLGLTLAGRLLANETDVPSRMRRLVSELIEQRDARLHLLQSEGRKGLDEENPVSLQAILGLSVRRLEETDQDRFAMVSIFGGEPLTWDIKGAASIWECSIKQAEETVSRFIQRGLVERREDHYWMHALLADYGADMLQEKGL